jgi:hypothetical protein
MVLVGSNSRTLYRKGHNKLDWASKELDLRNQQAVKVLWLPESRLLLTLPQKVGGILPTMILCTQFIMEHANSK